MEAPEEFEECLRANGPRLYTLALRLAGNEISGSYLAQRTFVQAYTQWAALRKEADAETWLRRIFLNLWKKNLRDEKRRTFWNQGPSMHGAMPFERTAAIDAGSDSAPTESALESIPDQTALQQALGRLESQDRTIFLLWDVENQALEVISKLLGLPLDEVKSRLASARVKVSEEFSKLAASKQEGRQFPEKLRQALKQTAAFTPPESFYTDILQQAHSAARPWLRWAPWLSTAIPWVASVAIIAISGVVVVSKIRRTAPKADPVYNAAPQPLPVPSPLPVAPKENTVRETPDDADPAVVSSERMTPKSWRGTDSAARDFRTVVITNSQDWSVLWQTYRKNQLSAPLPPVDFDHLMIVGIFAGTRPDLAAIEIVNFQETSDQLTVTYGEIPLGPRRRLRGSTNCPYYLQVIPKTSLPVHFEKMSAL